MAFSRKHYESHERGPRAAASYYERDFVTGFGTLLYRRGLKGSVAVLP
jgi:hypothetical protein